MSGTCGIVTFDGEQVPREAVERMCAAAAYRGRDGTSLWAGDGAVLAHQLVAVLPGDRPGRQPRTDGDRVVVADARLDNLDELVAALERNGLRAGDAAPPDEAEVLLAAYRLWGAACVERLVGDFAFVIWDAGSRTLVAARDPMGMRSLAYRLEPGHRVVFGTDVAQVLAAPRVPREPFERAIAADMTAHFGFPDWSFYEGISLLAPGHVLVCDARKHRVRRFWDVDPSLEVRHADLRAYAEHLRTTFCDAVAARLRTARPVGVLLSGGMDSGSAASTAGWLLERGVVPANEVLAAQWAFDELPQCDERQVSRLITGRFGFRDVDIPADGSGPLGCYPAHLPPVDDPMVGAFQPLIEHGLSDLAQLGAGVVLGGDRGDLLLGLTGASYLRMATRRQWPRLRDELRAHRVAYGDSASSLAREYFVDELVRLAGTRTPVGWLRWAGGRVRRSTTGAPSLPPWISPELARRTDLVSMLGEDRHVPEGLSPSAAARYRLIFDQLHVRGMAWSERTYARDGLVFADPFSDRRLASLVIALPQPVINRPFDDSKPLLREAMRGIMPEEARRAAEKVLPSPLFDQSLRRHVPLVESLLEDPQLAAHGWVDAVALRGHFRGWVAGGSLDSRFWWTLGIELWLRRITNRDREVTHGDCSRNVTTND